MQTDEELMAAYVAGDDAAFDLLFQRYAPMLLRMMRRQLAQPEDGQELVQQTFLQLHRARLDFEPGRRLRPWLMTIAFNLKREYFRRKKRRPEAPLDVDPAVDDPNEHRLERTQAAEGLQRALARLPEGQRVVIAMHWFDGLSFPEVAEITGLTLSAVKVRAHRGYRALRELLESEP